MMMSEEQEIAIDQQNAPHQFSSDYGISQDAGLNQYLNSVGRDIAQVSHRPQMPYNFQAVNATYVNAYAFPGGSIAMTRGILLEMENEAELAGLIGHEVAHVNARHSADRAARSQVASILAEATSAVISQSQYNHYSEIVNTLGGMGAGALLANYSRENEREEDALGINYMVQAGQNPHGMVGLMDMLNNTSQREPSIIERMFSSHPMSSERYASTVDQVNVQYGSEKDRSLNRERYIDNIANLRRIESSITEIQFAEYEMNQGNFASAESHFSTALKDAPDDYCGLVMSAKCQLTQEKYSEADQLLEHAKSVYPQEAQAVHLSEVTKLRLGQNQGALDEFVRYEQTLPGNPNTVFPGVYRWSDCRNENALQTGT